MAYLAIMFIAAIAGIARLWIQQRREHSHMETIDGFNTALEKISPEIPVPPRRAPNVNGVRRRPAEPRARASHRVGTGIGQRQPVPLDPDQRAAARRRIEARRRGRTRAAG